MKRQERTAILVLMLVLGALLPARTLFIQTIPINGIIGLQESFTLELKQQAPIVFNEDLAGRELEIATYEFFSNSPDVAYQLRIIPATTAGFRDDKFMFRYIDDETTDLKKKESTIPFRLSVLSEFSQAKNIKWESKVAEKSIGVTDGNRYRETGSIVITFPTTGEGFDFEELASGYYQANITVEVSTD